MDSITNRLKNVIYFLIVLSSDYHHISWLLNEHLLQIIGTGISLDFPSCRRLRTAVVALNARQMILQFSAFRCKYLQRRIHFWVHGFVNQAGMKMTWVQGHEPYFFFWLDRHFCQWFGTAGRAQKGYKNQKTHIIGHHEWVRLVY